MLAGLPIFANLSPEYLKALEEITQEISLAKGTLLFSPGDQCRGFYVVQDGAIRVYGRSPQGKEITQEIAGQGSAFALASPFAGTYHCFAVALKDSRIYFLYGTNLARESPGSCPCRFLGPARPGWTCRSLGSAGPRWLLPR